MLDWALLWAMRCLTVQAAADAVTGSNAEDGLVQALERFYFARLRCDADRRTAR